MGLINCSAIDRSFGNGFTQPLRVRKNIMKDPSQAMMYDNAGSDLKIIDNSHGMYKTKNLSGEKWVFIVYFCMQNKFPLDIAAGLFISSQPTGVIW